jgi:FMN phosphatase YigB (HAD superfamily)
MLSPLLTAAPSHPSEVRRVSLDIFDTLLVRRCGDPVSIFHLVGKELVRDGLAMGETFAAVRIEAERSKRHVASGAEPTFAEIYENVAFMLSLEPDLRDMLAARELAMEERMLTPTPGASALVAFARSFHASAIFISDMYLPAAFVQRQLQRWGLWKEGDHLYLSSEVRRSKRDASLFDLALAELSLAPRQLLHCGDDPHTDLASPASLGIRTFPIQAGRCNRYENILNRSPGTGHLGSLLAGASRLTRLKMVEQRPNGAPTVTAAAGVAAPLITAFTLWLLEASRSAGLQRLYFLSRDGQVLLEAARALGPKIGYTPELKYLYGGRRAWFLAASERIDSSLLEYLFNAPDRLTLNMVVERLGVHPGPLEAAWTGRGLARTSWDRPLLDHEIASARAAFKEPEVESHLLAEAAKQRDLIRRYFLQEQLDQPGAALVDVGWSGSMPRLLGALLSRWNWPVPETFFFGLRGCSELRSGLRPHAFLFDADLGLGKRHPHVKYATLVENFCVGDHGPLLGYLEREGRIEPDLKSPANEAPLRWGLPAYRETLAAFWSELQLPEGSLCFAPALRASVEELLEAFYLSPTAEEAAAWGRFPAETDPTGAYAMPWAEPYCWGDVGHSLARGHIPAENSTRWLPGSLAITPLPVRLALRAAGKLRRAAARLVHALPLPRGILRRALRPTG